MNEEITNVKTFFASIQVHLSDIWLESCVNWCKEETLGPHYTIKELQTKVYEQWLLLDLRDIEVAVLPPGLSTKQKFTLSGNFCLQMMEIVDISKPKLWQLQKIRNSNALTRGTQQESDVGTGKRVLQMTLTDGVQDIEAMEYKPISCLSLNLPPGTKIRIMGPVTIRRSRLMLEPHNVKVLGGEVDQLLICNAAENVLAKYLDLPQNSTPNAIEEKALMVENEETNTGYVPLFKNTLQEKTTTQVRKTTEEKQLEKTQVKKITEKKETAHKIEKKQEKKITEEEEMAKEIDLLLEAEAEFLGRNNDFDDFDFNDFNQSSTSTQVCQKPSTSHDTKDVDTSLDDVFETLDIDAHLNQLDKTEPNIHPISKILELQNNITKGNFKIKAKFKSIVEKLTFTDDEYRLVIEIEDDSGVLKTRLHSDIIASFAECSPAEVASLKNDILGKNARAVEKMMKAITNVKNRLLELGDVMTVSLEKNQVPVITKIT